VSDDYSIGAIRRMLLAALSPGELQQFCLDRPALEEAIARFGPGMGLDDMVAEVLDFCRTRLAWGDLLVGVQQERGAVYSRFEPELRRSPQVAQPQPQPILPSPPSPRCRSTLPRQPYFFGRAKELATTLPPSATGVRRCASRASPITAKGLLSSPAT
jgi:hypothetical protein